MTCACERQEIAPNVSIVTGRCAACLERMGKERPLYVIAKEASLIAEELNEMARERLRAKGKL